MVQKAKDKGKRTAGPAEASQATPEQRIASLEAERDTLKAALETARRRIEELEQSRSQVASRIDSVINSLNNLGDMSE